MDSIKISNFRKIKESWEFDLAPITFFTGKNNSGKSSALKALMVFSDYTNSSNHFELDFLGENASSHKIENYSNAINWKNNTKSNIAFEFNKSGYAIALEFSPDFLKNDSNFQNGILESFTISNDLDNSKIELKRRSVKSYELSFNNRFLNQFKASRKPAGEIRQLIRSKNTIKDEIKNTELDIKKKLGIAVGASLSTGALIGALSLGPIGWVAAAGTALTGYLTNKKLNDLDDKTKILLKTKLEKLNEDLKVIDKKINMPDAKKVKIKEEVIFSPTFNLGKLFLSDPTLTNVFKRVLIPYFQDRLKDLGNIDVKDETIKLDAFSNEFLELFQFEVDHLSPHRYDQERLILNEGTSDDLSKIAKNQIKKGIKKGSNADEFILEWMNKFDIGVDYEIISVYGQASIINVFEEGIKNPINIADKGFGAGQIFTILLKIAEQIDSQKINLKKNYYLPLSGMQQIVIIEEPEANLHPALQVKLANLFYETYKDYSIKFIVETHSEYLIRRSQVIVKQLNESIEKKIGFEIPFMAYYFEKDDIPYSMEYNKDGKFSNEFGSGFFDVSSNLAFDIL